MPTVAPRYGAPLVAGERQLGNRVLTPCTALLKPADLKQLGIDPASADPRTSVTGPSCGWYANRAQDYPSLSLTTTPGRNVFVDVFRARLFPIFTPTTIDGLPAVAEMNRPDDISCVVTVGVNNDEGLSAWWYADPPITAATEPCANATKALAAVVSHLPPK